MIELLNALQVFIAQGGWLAVLLLVLVTGARRWWYFSYTVEDLKAQLAAKASESEEWKQLYLDLMAQQRSLVEVVETASRRGR